MKTVSLFQRLKDCGEKIALLTAYDYSTAQVLDKADIDGILVGDSLAMVVLGQEDTMNVTVDEMAIFTKAVSRGAKSALIVADMPFMSYQASIEEGIRNAGKLIKAGAKAVGATGAKSLGKFVPGIGMGIAIVVIVWDLWDYKNTADKGRRELRAGFAEYFQGLKAELLGPTEDSIMGSIVMWENAIRANL